MKALSLREPWMTAVLDLGKRIENRQWNTRFRGLFLLHCASQMTALEYESACNFMRRSGVSPPLAASLRTQGIVGAAILVDVIRPNTRPMAAPPGLDIWWMPDQYGFVLTDVLTFPLVIPCRGMPGFFAPPPDVVTNARAAIIADAKALLLL